VTVAAFKALFCDNQKGC